MGLSGPDSCRNVILFGNEDTQDTTRRAFHYYTNRRSNILITITKQRVPCTPIMMKKSQEITVAASGFMKQRLVYLSLSYVVFYETYFFREV